MLTKPVPVISKKIRRFARGRPCALRIPGVCSDNGANTCACHVNSNRKGTGNKSPDLFTVIGCPSCHRWMDSEWAGKVSKDQRDAEILRAMIETQTLYLQAGLVEVL